MVSNPDTDHVICWAEDGESFVVKDKAAMGEILGTMFKHAKFSSWNRNANMYQFSKASSRGVTRYSHPGFKRGAPELLATIKRKNPAGGAAGASSSGATQALRAQVHLLRSERDDLAAQVTRLSKQSAQAASTLHELRSENSRLWDMMRSYEQAQATMQHALQSIMGTLVQHGSRLDGASAEEAARFSASALPALFVPVSPRPSPRISPRPMSPASAHQASFFEQELDRRFAEAAAATAADPEPVLDVKDLVTPLGDATAAAFPYSLDDGLVGFNPDVDLSSGFHNRDRDRAVPLRHPVPIPSSSAAFVRRPSDTPSVTRPCPRSSRPRSSRPNAHGLTLKINPDDRDDLERDRVAEMAHAEALAEALSCSPTAASARPAVMTPTLIATMACHVIVTLTKLASSRASIATTPRIRSRSASSSVSPHSGASLARASSIARIVTVM